MSDRNSLTFTYNIYLLIILTAKSTHDGLPNTNTIQVSVGFGILRKQILANRCMESRRVQNVIHRLSDAVGMKILCLSLLTHREATVVNVFPSKNFSHLHQIQH